MWQYYNSLYENWSLIPNASTLSEARSWVTYNYANSGIVKIREVRLEPIGEPVEVETDWSNNV